MERDLKILIVDDAVLDRTVLSKVIAGFDHVELLGVASNGRIALNKIRNHPPDLVLLDVFMPEMGGLETLKHIKKDFSHIDVVMLSGIDPENAGTTMKALESGALDFIPKPRGHSMEANMAELRNTLFRLVSMARTRKYSRQARFASEQRQKILRPQPIQAPVQKIPAQSSKQPAGKVSHVRQPQPQPIILPENRIRQIPPVIRAAPRADRMDVVVIGVSTGGPNALQELIPGLPSEFPVPILAVQHMPPMFTASLASRLNDVSSIGVVEGAEGQRVEPGIMYIAPGGMHMVVRKEGGRGHSLGMVSTPPVNSCRPSADVLFRSAAMIYGGNILAIILTGMGNDGASGVAAIRRKGGYSIVQDETTSVIWGMPGAVAESGDADEIAPLDQIAQRIMRMVSKNR